MARVNEAVDQAAKRVAEYILTYHLLQSETAVTYLVPQYNRTTVEKSGRGGPTGQNSLA